MRSFRSGLHTPDRQAARQIACRAAGSSPTSRPERPIFAKLHGYDLVDEALRATADAGRFADGDLAAILAQHGGEVIAFPMRGDEPSVQRSAAAWEGFGA